MFRKYPLASLRPDCSAARPTSVVNGAGIASADPGVLATDGARATDLGDRDLPASAEVLPGQRTRGLEHVLVGPLGDDFTAVHAGAGPEIDDVVGGADRALVVLDHDHRVAEVAQALEGGNQALVVALVQADRRLVEDVEHAHQARADLRREADALCLAARERSRRA